MPGWLGLERLLMFGDDAGARVTADSVQTDAAGRLSSGYLPVLDGVRGVAILLVMLHHLAHSLRAEFGIDGSALAFARAGWVGVDLFFVLSGYLITRNLLEARGKPLYFRNFYARRALRIFPLYYGALTGAFLLVAIVPSWSAIIGTGEYAFGLWLYLTNIFTATAGWETYGWLVHFWSLAIEEHFYLVWPFVVLVCGPRTLLVVAAGIVVVGPVLRLLANAYGAGPDVIYFLTPFRADALATGALLAGLVRVNIGRRWVARSSAPVGIAAAVGVFLIGLRAGEFDYRDGLVHTLGFTLVLLMFGAVVAALLTADRGRLAVRAIGSRPLRAVGTVSYGLYVLHVPIFTAWFHTDGGQVVLDFVGLWSPAGATIAAVSTSLAAALCSWRFWERPFLRLKKHFEGHADAPVVWPAATKHPDDENPNGGAANPDAVAQPIRSLDAPSDAVAPNV